MDWNSGPDNIHPTDSYTSYNLRDPVKLRNIYNNASLSNNMKPVSLYTLFKYQAISYPDHIVLGTYFN